MLIKIWKSLFPKNNDLVRRKSERKDRIKFKIFAFLSIIAFCSICLGFYLFLNSDFFSISSITMLEPKYADSDLIKQKCKRYFGINTWAVDKDSLAADISSVPWVESAKVARKIPATLYVRLTEYEPVCLIDIAGRKMAMLSNGLFQEINNSAQFPELPFLINEDGSDKLPNEMQCDIVLSLVTTLKKLAFEKNYPVDFILVKDSQTSIILQSSHIELVIGDEKFEQRLSGFSTVAYEVADNSVVDLRFENQVYISDGQTTPK